MKLIKLNATSPGMRHQLNLAKNLLSKKNNLYKNLNFNNKENSGRSSSTGAITVRRRGGGCKKNFRQIKFNNFVTKSIVLMVNYDPQRNSFISLNFDFLKNIFFNSISTHTTYPGTLLTCQKNKIKLYFGNRSILANFPVGVLIHSVSPNLCIKKVGALSCSAGTYCQILQKQNTQIQIRMPSGKIVALNQNAFVTFGRVSNIKYNLVITGKAGRNRLKGIRPHVRGIAMNPVDHPHGGRTNGGRPSVSLWGKLTKGKKTVKKNG